MLKIKSIVLSLVMLATISMSIASYADSNYYYAFLKGDGERGIVSIQVNDRYEHYIVSTDYFGKDVVIVEVNDYIDDSNYKDIQITNIKFIDLDTNEPVAQNEIINNINKIINDYNNGWSISQN